MVNGTQTLGSAGSAPLFVRASAAATLSVESTGTAEPVASQLPAQAVPATGNAYRYNSFEFSYRQDFGKVVLLRQKPDTGEVVQQFPSEYYLRKYADSERVARSAEDSGAAQAAAEQAVPEGDSAKAVTASPATSVVAAPVNIAPTVQSAPALPSGGVSAATAHVDLTI